MRKIVRWFGQLLILCGVFWTGSQLAEWSGLPVPGSVVGVVLLFFLLLFGVIQLEYVEEVADYLLKHLVLFFIPIAAALMDTADIFRENGWTLAVVIIIGVILPLWAAGTVTQMIRRRCHECKD